jgi:transcriptional regulator with XRE-family HTH domain
MTYKNRIRALRTRRNRMGASLEAIAQKVGRTRSWLSLIELGNLRTSAENLQRIENAIVEYEYAFSAVQQILGKDSHT